jgi:hypothetical protein
MKRTNTLLSTFWVKAVPVILLLACIGITNAHAQNYKPLNEAIASVNTSLDGLKSQKGGNSLNQSSPGTAKTNGMSPSQSATANVKVFEVSYYERFMELAKENNDVAAGVQALDAQFTTAGQPQSRVTTVTNARNELMHLITY